MRSSSSGCACITKSTTAAVTRPSTTPIARWMGCISSTKVANGSALIPEAVVSSTTREGAELQTDDGGEQAAGDDAPARRCAPAADDPSVDERVGDERREEAEVEDVGAQGQQTAVREEQSLHGEDRGHHEEGRLRAQQDGEDQRSPEVTARAGARDREVEHLGGEDEGAGDAHERDLALVEVVAYLARAVDGGGRGGAPHGAARLPARSGRRPCA